MPHKVNFPHFVGHLIKTMKTLLNIILLFTLTKGYSQTLLKQQNKMKIAVWDTYVTKKDGTVMHFDILAPEAIRDTNQIFGYGKAYLKTKNQEGQSLTSKECRFCHIETLRPSWEAAIEKQGYYIIEMENCK